MVRSIAISLAHERAILLHFKYDGDVLKERCMHHYVIDMIIKEEWQLFEMLDQKKRAAAL